MSGKRDGWGVCILTGCVHRLRSGRDRQGAAAIAAIAMIPEVEATGMVSAIYGDIETTLGIDFIPNLYTVMAVVDLFSGFNTLVDGLRVEQDDTPWYG
jgi:hypothetical protein